jgi:hypothetical protein
LGANIVEEHSASIFRVEISESEKIAHTMVSYPSPYIDEIIGDHQHGF